MLTVIRLRLFDACVPELQWLGELPVPSLSCHFRFWQCDTETKYLLFLYISAWGNTYIENSGQENMMIYG